PSPERSSPAAASGRDDRAARESTDCAPDASQSDARRQAAADAAPGPSPAESNSPRIPRADNFSDEWCSERNRGECPRDSRNSGENRSPSQPSGGRGSAPATAPAVPSPV